ncbi:MAG: alpha-E domain-containing protein [Geminicoccaceae bacterium]|nr:alpha-E domain-containing protein [Geminicoccaceae bacterium]MCB9942540.1 alpha-E domain-containing protein [Geminicoccaceae bacterium]
MLSRTASSLFWVGRYIERMDYVARLIEVAQHMSMLPTSEGAGEWKSAIIAAGCEDEFFAKHGEVTAHAVIDYLSVDRDNPSSILASLATARANARAVRSALSSDTWDAINSTYLEARRLEGGHFGSDRLGPTLDWIKMRALLINGAYNNTMLRSQAYDFLRLGCFLERSDNTARILDVKYHILLPSYEKVGGVVDFYQWVSVLRAVSARRAYHVLYKDRIRPWNIAEMMILRPEMPRSMRACSEQVTSTLDRLQNAHGGRSGECHRLAGVQHAGLRYGRIDDILKTGLHEFLTDHIDRIAVLGEEITTFYLT